AAPELHALEPGDLQLQVLDQRQVRALVVPRDLQLRLALAHQALELFDVVGESVCHGTHAAQSKGSRSAREAPRVSGIATPPSVAARCAPGVASRCPRAASRA